MQVPGAVQRFVNLVQKTGKSLRKEQEISQELHRDAEATVRSLERQEEGLRERLERAYAFAIFPSVGQASAVLGATYGRGEVFRHGRLAGYAGIVQLTLGVQLGGETFTELVIFDDEAAFNRFKQGGLQFAADAAAVVVKAGAAVTNDGRGAEIRLYSQGGFQLEAAIGGQKFVFKPAGLTRGKRLAHAEDVSEAEDEHPSKRDEHPLH